MRHSTRGRSSTYQGGSSMTIEEYTKQLRELTYDFEHSQGALVELVTIAQNEDEPNILDITITTYN